MISVDGSNSCSEAQLVAVGENGNVEVLEHVTCFTAGDMTTGEHMINQLPHTEVPVTGNNYCVKAQCLHSVLQEGMEGQDCLIPPDDLSDLVFFVFNN